MLKLLTLLIAIFLLAPCSLAQEAVAVYPSIEAARQASDNKTVVLYFGAAWCKPCQQMKAITFKSATLAEETTDFQFVMFDLDEDVEMATRYRVSAVPTMIVLDAENLSPIGGATGFLSDERLLQFLRDTVANPAKLPPTIMELENSLADSNVEVAHAALDQIMEQLADSQRTDRTRLVEMLNRQSDQIVSELVLRLEDPRLSIRAASVAVLEVRWGRQLEFDPFASSENRAGQVDVILDSVESLRQP